MCSFVNTLLAPGFAPAAGSGDKALEQPSGPGQVCRQLLGVALHRNDKPVVGLHAFDRAVLSLRGLVQPWGEAADSLVVEAVDADLVLAGGMAELRAWIDDLDGVRTVTAAEASNIVVLEVLHQRSTQGDVDDLLAPADAEDGNLLRSEERRVGKEGSTRVWG